SAPSVLRWSMPRTAVVTGKVGSTTCACSIVRLRRPPGYPVYRVYSLVFSLLPVTFTFAALITTTWSPLFRLGVNVGLCLPRRIAATPDARRPSTWSVASTTYQSLFRSAAFAVHVFCLLIVSVSMRALCARRSVNHFHQCQTPGGGGARRLAAVARLEDLAHPLRRPLAATHLGQRARDAARQASQEALRDQLQLDEPTSPHDACGAHLAHPGVWRLGGRAVAGPVVLADQGPGGLRHRRDVEVLPDVPAAPPLQRCSRRPIKV